MMSKSGCEPGNPSGGVCAEVLVSGIFFIRPLPGRRRPPLVSRLVDHGEPFQAEFTQDRHDCIEKSPTKTLNKRSLWESLFRPRTRPPKCAIPYFRALHFFNFWCKSTPTWRLRCTPARASAVAYCTGPTTPANPRRAPKRFLETLDRDGAFAATCAASVQRRCR